MNAARREARALRGYTRRMAAAIAAGALALALADTALAARGGGAHSGGGGWHGGHSYGGHGHSSVGFYFSGGWPYYWPYYDRPYYSPYYGYYPYSYAYPYAPYSYAPAEYSFGPPVYAEQQQESSWYYCPAAQGFYPYVTECPNGEWQRVSPRPAPGSDNLGRSSDAPAR